MYRKGDQRLKIFGSLLDPPEVSELCKHMKLVKYKPGESSSSRAG